MADSAHASQALNLIRSDILTVDPKSLLKTPPHYEYVGGNYIDDENVFFSPRL